MKVKLKGRGHTVIVIFIIKMQLLPGVFIFLDLNPA